MAIKALSMVTGALDIDSFSAVIFSKIGDDVTVECNGESKVVTMLKLGDDRSEADPAGETWACYYGVAYFSGLNHFTDYEVVASQLTASDTVNICTIPNTNKSKIAIALATCFSPMNNLFTRDTPTSWDFLKYYIDTSEYKVLACLFSDDICYPDGFFGCSANFDNDDGKKFTTNRWRPTELRPEYDYALNYAMWAGIHGEYKNSFLPEIDFGYMDVFLSDSFQYCMSNMAFMPQWGDHEFINNIGWAGGVALNSYPNPYHKDASGFNGVGYNVWQAVMAPLQGKPIKSESYAVDTDANHWYQDFGPLRYITADPITNAVYDTSLYGTNQIEDILNCANEGSQWFTCFSRPAGAGRKPSNYETEYLLDGFIYKNENYVESEYNRLYLDDNASPQSFMLNSKTNGILGTMFTVRGDWHQGGWLYYNAPSGAGILAESINEIPLNTVTNSAGATGYWKGDDSFWQADNVELIGAITNISIGINKPNKATMTIAEIDGESTTPQVKIIQWSLEVPYDESYTMEDHFTETDNIERITDEKGSVWRKIAECIFPLNSGDNKGKLSSEDVSELTNFSLSN